MTSGTSINPFLETAIEAVAAACRICDQVKARIQATDTLTKTDRSPVTVADFASQAVVCALLKNRFAAVPVVAEEDADALVRPENLPFLEKAAALLGGWSLPATVAAIQWGCGHPGGLFFTLDPIDGTKGFLRGGQYAVALALIRGGRVELGVLGCPELAMDGAKGMICWAVQGQGAFAGSLAADRFEPIRVARGLAPVRFVESVEAGHSDHGRQEKIKAGFDPAVLSVRLDSQAKYAALALGQADVYLRLPSPDSPNYREKIWDHAAGALIVAEAGGRVTDADGKELDFRLGRRLEANRGVVATNGYWHAAVLERIQGTLCCRS
jgi:3'(2'), 5'-bisphosphate nucleotidase